MPAWNPEEGLASIGDACLDAAIDLDYLMRGKNAPKFKEHILLITTELQSWGLDDLETFKKATVPSVFCWKLLQQRDGYEKWPERATSYERIFEVWGDEYKNLLNLLSGNAADAKQAYEFCLFLHRASLAVQYEISGPRRLVA